MMWISWIMAAALAVPPVEPPPTETTASWLLGSTLASSHGYDTLRTLCDDYGARLSGKHLESPEDRTAWDDLSP